MKNLWEKDRKTVYKELYSQYLQEGYSPKEAKKYASEETEEFMSGEADFVKELFSYQEEDCSDMWNMLVKTSHNIETLLEDSEYEEDIWKLLGDRKLFTSQMGYDIEETIDGFVAKRNGETVATYRILRED